MKTKFLILLMCIYISSNAQSDYYTVLETDGSTSGAGRAPQGGGGDINRSIWLITAAEMKSSGFPAGSIINSLGFFYIVGLKAPILRETEDFSIYLENTTNSTNSKSAYWPTAIAAMTLVSTKNIVHPSTPGLFLIPFSGGSTFTYTGGSLYIAFASRYYGGSSTILNSAATNTSLAKGILTKLKLENEAGLGYDLDPVSAFRPKTILGRKTNCAWPFNLGFDSPTTTSANLFWDRPDGGFTNVEYGVEGFALGTGRTETSLENSRVISGLSPSTVYQFYTKTNCSPGVSNVNGPFAFHTSFLPTSVPYNTSFETYGIPYIGWQTYTDQESYSAETDWFIFNSKGNSSSLVRTGKSSIVSINSNSSYTNSFLFSRSINLTAGQLTTISFYMKDIQSTNPRPSFYPSLEFYAKGPEDIPDGWTTGTNAGIFIGGSTPNFTKKTITFTPTLTGPYYFTFSYISSIETKSGAFFGYAIDDFTVTQGQLSITDFDESSLSIYPNPATNIVTISNTNSVEISAIAITDLSGRIIKQATFDRLTNVQINIGNLAKGVYLMKITSNKGTTIEKIIKN